MLYCFTNGAMAVVVVLDGGVYAKHNETLILVFLIYLFDGRHFGAARRTPCRPEIDEHSFSAVVLSVKWIDRWAFRV